MSNDSTPFQVTPNRFSVTGELRVYFHNDDLYKKVVAGMSALQDEISEAITEERVKMCQACYEECGSPKIINDKTIKCAKLIDAIYEYSCVGSNLHIIIDDFNIEDCQIEWCLTEAIKENIHESDEDQLNIEIECLEALKVMTMDERASSLAIHCGWLKV